MLELRWVCVPLWKSTEVDAVVHSSHSPSGPGNSLSRLLGVLATAGSQLRPLRKLPSPQCCFWGQPPCNRRSKEAIKSCPSLASIRSTLKAHPSSKAPLRSPETSVATTLLFSSFFAQSYFLFFPCAHKSHSLSIGFLGNWHTTWPRWSTIDPRTTQV